MDREAAIEYCKGMINDLLQNRIDLSLLVITKGLCKKIGGGPDEEVTNEVKEKGKKADGDTYNANLAHVALAKRMQKRDMGSAPTVGDRVSYVMIKGAKGQKAYELAEDPIYVVNYDMPIDFHHYIENQIKLPLIRIFEPIFGSTSKAEHQLFNGDHTRSIYHPKVASSGGGLGKFAIVKATCMGCKKVLHPTLDKDDVICQACQPKKKQIFIERKL